MSDHSERDLLRELFPETARELFGSGTQAAVPTLGLFPVADGRLALISGGHLAELEPIEQKGSRALHCDLCHYTRSRNEAALYRVRVAARYTRYLTLCSATTACQARAGEKGLNSLAERIFPIETMTADEH
jgi:hypothetical protein